MNTTTTLNAPGFHGITAITECPQLDAVLISNLAQLMIEEDLETASAEFDKLADEHSLLRWQRQKLIERAKSHKARMLRNRGRH